MSKPIDLKTVKIFEPLKKKPSFENKIFNTLNPDEIYDILSNHSNETVNLWFKLQQAWCNNAYNTFKDYDSYLILIYLVNQVFQKYSDRFQYLSFQEFYEKNELNIDKINLIEISKELNIPKETIRRKVNFLQDQNIIFRKGKTIFFNNAINRVQKPSNSKKMLVNFLEKTSSILGKEEWFGKSFSKEEIEGFIDKYFTICWQHWLRLQIPYLVRFRTFFGDLETWNVWGAIGISQFTDYSKQVKSRVVEDPRTYADLYLHLLRHTPKNGINASSISEISTIPRATVIRKLKYLLKQKLVTKNKKLEYMLLPSPKNIKSFEENYMHNQKHKAGFVTTIFDLMKNSSFKVE
jgi:predicted transcriptional regulator